MLTKPLLLILFCTSIGSFCMHPIHLSVSHINYDDKLRNFNIVHTLFLDDFENAIQKIEAKTLNLGTIKQHKEADALIAHYAQKHFYFYAGNKKLNFEMLGWKIENDVIKIYAESQTIKKVKAIRIQNTFFFDLFDDQRNIVHVNYKGRKKSLMADKSRRSDTLSFD